jgi:hypothetical protein
MKLKELKPKILAEMSNIDFEEHKAGIDMTFHILQPGTWNHSGHGPRIKIFKGNYKSSLKIVIILDKDSNNIKVLESSFNPKLIKRSELNNLIVYFKKYRYAYLIMWLDQGMSNIKLIKSLEETDKNPDLIKKRFETLYKSL